MVAPETLPLSAPPASQVRVELEIVRAHRSQIRVLEVPEGTLLRQALRTLGMAAEGCAVLDAGQPVPLDIPITRPVRLTLIPTFSGG